MSRSPSTANRLLDLRLPHSLPILRGIRAGSPASTERYVPVASERSDQTKATIVIVLTFACTALSVVDLYLLASGVP